MHCMALERNEKPDEHKPVSPCFGSPEGVKPQWSSWLVLH